MNQINTKQLNEINEFYTAVNTLVENKDCDTLAELLKLVYQNYVGQRNAYNELLTQAWNDLYTANTKSVK